jgi:hypothetical protein
VYSLPAGNPVTTATTISSTWANNTLTDIANALTGSLSSDGQTPLTGNLNVNNNNLTNVNQINTVNIVSTGTVTGGTGVVNYGSGQFYKDASGNVGLGTTSPSALLHINGTTFIPALIQSSASTTDLYFKDANTTGYGPFVGSAGNSLAFGRVGVAEYGRFDPVGNLLFGTTSYLAGGGPFIQAKNSTQYGQFIAGDSGLYWNFGRDNVTTGYFIFGWLGTQVSYINNSTGVYTAISDKRLKKNITPLQYGLKEVLALNPVMYNMKTEADTKKKHIGLIAQEVKVVMDELVEDIDETKQNYGLSATELVPVLIKAIQELNARIVVLEAKK